MASINPTSVSVIRPYAGAVNARANAKNAIVEGDAATRTVKLNRPAVERVATEPAPTKPDIKPLNDGPLKANGVTPASIDHDAIIEPVDTSGISARTDAVLEHTIKILMERGGIEDADTLSAALGGIIEPLVAQDGVANPKAAAMQYIKDYIAELQASSDAPGSMIHSHGKNNALDLEG